jgi:hypothetical protein
MPQVSPFVLPEDTSVIISDTATGATLFRCSVAQLRADLPDSVIPRWVADCLLEVLILQPARLE